VNYELKSIQPGSVFFNGIRIFLIVGFIVAILSFFVLPNPSIRITLWWQKLAATFLFTIIYAIVVSVVLTLVAWLYNFWAANFRGIRVRFEQEGE
jgi:hypothetical protein